MLVKLHSVRYPASGLSERSGDPDSSGLECSGNPASAELQGSSKIRTKDFSEKADNTSKCF